MAAINIDYPPEFGERPVERPTIVFPITVIADRSESMGWRVGPEDNERPIDTVNAGLSEIVRTLKVNPDARHLIYMSIVSFSDSATVDLPPTHMPMVNFIPALKADGSTSYTDAFQRSAQTTASLIQKLTEEKVKAYRPTWYLLSDGQPNCGGWEQALAQIDPEPWAPNICAFGTRGATEETLSRVKRRKGVAFRASGGDSATAFATLFPVLMVSIVNSVNCAAGAAQGQGSAPPPPIPPEPPEGWDIVN